MKELILKNFKAFSSEVRLTCDGMNTIIYGENGSGKSSLFEAIKLYYFTSRIFRMQISPIYVDEDRKSEEHRIIEEYKPNPLEEILLEVDGKPYNPETAHNENVFLISYEDLHGTSDDEVNIKKLLSRSFFSCVDQSLQWYVDDLWREIVRRVNEVLDKSFLYPSVRLQLVDGGEGLCSLEWNGKVTPKSNHLTQFFNESILHVIRLVMLIEGALLLRDASKESLLVMDDCFNSIDMPNRSFMMRYILQMTGNIKKIVLTHSVTFFNLYKFCSNNCQHTECASYRLHKQDGEYVLSDWKDRTVKELKADYKKGYSVSLGNDIRRRFEYLIARIVELLQIGRVAETDKLIRQLLSGEQIYIFRDQEKLKYSDDLVRDLETTLNGEVEENLKDRLIKKIEKYKKHKLEEYLIPVLLDLRLMRKIAMHPSSHGAVGALPPVSEKEILFSLTLLESLEKTVNDLEKVEDVSTI